MKKDTLHVLRYFSVFGYAPTFDEIYLFFPTKISRKQLKKELEVLIREKRLTEQAKRYTLGEYKEQEKWYKKRWKISKTKIRTVQSFIRILSLFPQIKLIGLSGSIAMMNADLDDDVDFFIITAKNRLWTGRFIGLLVAAVLGLRRKRGSEHAPDKVCLNMFFDEKNMAIPAHKQTLYVGHEVMQMKPVVNKFLTHERFLGVNKWVFQLFPNAKSSIPNFFDSMSVLAPLRTSQVAKKLVSSLTELLERLLKALQLFFIKKHKTTEIITDAQLWFFPDDFEKKMKVIGRQD